jgi:2-oxo-4-hydroxy-4-carboxy-5-ureidoimidazoline decarboxylase
MNLDRLNTLSSSELQQDLLRCCGAKVWVQAIFDLRPFESTQDLHAKADKAFTRMSESDWLEAFKHHPKIGNIDELKKKFASTASWAQNEQRSMQETSDDILMQFSDLNREYEQKFGFIFIVCATGKSAHEMLDMLKNRIGNSRNIELKTASEEQIKITHLRLEKLP